MSQVRKQEEEESTFRRRLRPIGKRRLHWFVAMWRRTPAEAIQSEVAGGFGSGQAAPRNNETLIRTNDSGGVVVIR